MAGRWRGRKLLSPQGKDIRPTTDRVKEAMFSIAGPLVRDSLVLDLCSGTGGLGLEALSRGARRVIMVDSSRASLDLAGKNLKLCGAESGSYDLIKANAEVFFKNWTPPTGGPPWILLCDPPYHSNLADSILTLLLDEKLAPGFVFGVIEHDDATAFDEVDEGPWRLNTRRYGETCLTIVRPG